MNDTLVIILLVLMLIVVLIGDIHISEHMSVTYKKFNQVGKKVGKVFKGK